MRPKRVFIIQPFLAKHSDTFYKLVTEVCDKSQGEFEAFRADKEPTKAGPRLQERIDSYIKGADICLADVDFHN